MARAGGSSGRAASEAALVAAIERREARFFLLHGADDSEVDRIARRLMASALGEGGERVDLTSADVKADPARVGDEAAALSLFGGHRAIRLTIGREDISDVIEALLDQPGADNPVIASAGNLNAANRVLKLAQSHAAARVLLCAPPGAEQVAADVVAYGKARGLLIRRGDAQRIAELVANDRSLARLEVDKYALYLDAEPDRPVPLTGETIDRVGAAREEDDVNRLASLALAGKHAEAAADLAEARANGAADIAIVRALLRRVQQTARAAGNGGRGFWGDRDLAGATLDRWAPKPLADLNRRLLLLEDGLMHGAAAVTLEREVARIARPGYGR